MLIHETFAARIRENPFQPLWWMPTGTLQTVGSYLFTGGTFERTGVRHEVPLADGDRLVVIEETPGDWRPGDRGVVLIHGLCGEHRSPYMRRIAGRLNSRGLKTFSVDMRGWGASTLVSRSHSHAGSSQDIQDVVAWIGIHCPDSPLGLIGFSLGGNILLKALAEWGSAVPPHLDRAIAISPPIDLAHASRNLRRNANRLYDYYFMRRLKRTLTLRRNALPDLVDNGLAPLPGRLLEFDDQFVAPVIGLRDADEYYAISSAGPMLNAIQLPTIIVATGDDPIVPYAMFDRFPRSDAVSLCPLDRGGHLGFLGRASADPDLHWLDWRLVEWATAEATPPAMHISES